MNGLIRLAAILLVLFWIGVLVVMVLSSTGVISPELGLLLVVLIVVAVILRAMR